MKFYSPLVVVATAASTVLAATSTPSAVATSSASSTSSAAATTHTVEVGLSGFSFMPNSTKAAKGDVIAFRFHPGGHSVVRAAFGYPCIPYNYVYNDQTIFFSGFENPPNATSPIVWYLPINDTEPIFYYCSAPDACVKDGMIGVINENSTMTLVQQEEVREQGGQIQLSPGDPYPSEGSTTASIPSATATSAPASTSTTAPATSSSAASDASAGGGGGTSLSSGAIAGIAIGAAAVLILAAALVYVCGRKGGIEKGYRRSTMANPQTPGPMVEAQYADATKSPQPQELHSPYGPPGSETYRSGTSSPHWSQNGAYAGQPSPGMSYMDTQYSQAASSPPLPQEQQYQPQQAPVELPTSQDPGNSPLPGYTGRRTFSWRRGAETSYRPGEKPDEPLGPHPAQQ